MVDEGNFNTFAGVALIAAEVDYVMRKNHPIVGLAARAVMTASTCVMMAQAFPELTAANQPSFSPPDGNGSF